MTDTYERPKPRPEATVEELRVLRAVVEASIALYRAGRLTDEGLTVINLQTHRTIQELSRAARR